MDTTTEAPADAVVRVVGTGTEAYEAAQARAAALARVDHPGICVPRRVLARDGGEVVAVMPRVDGIDLAALLRGRGSLPAGECVTLGIQVAEALAALHRAGIAHGDISPANVMIRDGRAVLVDTVAGAMPHESGTEPYAAPERAQGASATSDVYALGKVLSECVSSADRELIEAFVEPMLTADPAARAHAPMVARALALCAEPQPVGIPVVGVAGAVRTRAQGPASRTTLLASAKGWRVRKAAIKWGAVAGVAAAAVAGVAIAVPHAMAVINPPTQPHFDPPMPIPAGAAVSPDEGARLVTEARFAALAAGDAEALEATGALDSPAGTAAEQQAQALREGALRFAGVEVAVLETEVVTATGRRATVAVTYEVSAHTVYVDDVATPYEQHTQEVTLDLTWSEAGWQVVRARPRS